MHAVRTPSGQSIILDFDDNRVLALLFGEHDRHLARIEERHRRGGRLARQPADDQRRLRRRRRRRRRFSPISTVAWKAAPRSEMGDVSMVPSA
jgi:phosphate starvation-inducible PhoH-like protein